MKNLSLICLLLLSSQVLAATRTVRVLHYNIKELDSTKIQKVDNQMAYVKKILGKKYFDILSLNEIQYDLPNVPNKNFQTRGGNLSALQKYFKLSHLKEISFFPANTGENAKTKADGTYFIKPNTAEARSHADQLNFGVMPAQYSTGGMFKYKILNELIIKDLKWKDFNPKADFSKFKTADGKPFPDDMKLFDKNFSDITINIHGKAVHIILLHTVPSYHFGNKHSINMYRNAQQLKFLEWYLTGNTDFKVPLSDIKPLKKTDYYFAMGDFNVSVTDSEDGGAKVLKRLFKKANPWINIEKMEFTSESSGYRPSPNRFMLDYIISSKNIKPLYGEIMVPEMDRIELGCEQKMLEVDLSQEDLKKYKKVEYKKDEQTCFAYINKEYFHYKEASDHFPLYGEFEL